MNNQICKYLGYTQNIIYLFLLIYSIYLVLCFFDLLCKQTLIYLFVCLFVCLFVSLLHNKCIDIGPNRTLFLYFSHNVVLHLFILLIYKCINVCSNPFISVITN